MVTKIVLDINENQNKIAKSFGDFWSEELISLEEIILTKDSDCGNYEYVYVFCEQSVCSSLTSIFLKNGITIFETQDVTDYIINIINSNQISEFKNNLSESSEETFDDIMHEFISNYITKDMVLDKINSLGIASLTECDYKILND